MYEIDYNIGPNGTEVHPADHFTGTQVIARLAELMSDDDTLNEFNIRRATPRPGE